jgi:4-amino-4-deoxy-L-arabinose transferase-like glycosyltransferase
MTVPGPQRLALRVVQLVVIALLAFSVFLAVVIPFHATDSLVYGQWSRLIGVHGGFYFDTVGYTPYSRPLYFVPQGWLWELFGGHEYLGRLWSLIFFGILLWAVFRLTQTQRLPPAAPWMAVILLFASPDVVQQALAGQTDVPVAAMIALAGLLAFRASSRPSMMGLLGLVCAAALITKATSLPALGALALAMLLGDRRNLLRRVRAVVVPIVAGTVAGLVYDLIVARHFDMSLGAFAGLTSNTSTVAAGAAGPDSSMASHGMLGRTSDAISALGDADRGGVLLRGEWIGPYVRLLLLFSVVYAVLRIVRVTHRTAALGALGAGLIAYWFGLDLVPGGAGISSVSAGALLGSVLLTVPLLGVAWCPPQVRADRLLLARLLVWAIPPFLAWGLYGIIADTRTLSTAWPALFVLMGGVMAMGVAGLAQRRAWLGAAAILLLVALTALNFRNYDALGSRPDGSLNSLRALRELGPSTWTDPDAARSAADPQLGGLVADTRAARPAGKRVWTNDGRMIFYFLEQTTATDPPHSCSELGGYGVVSLLLNVAAPFDASSFPCLTPVRVVPGSYGVWRVTTD